MRESHIQTGSVEKLCKALKIEKVRRDKNSLAFFGLKVVLNRYMPEDKAVMVASDGTITAVFDLKN